MASDVLIFNWIINHFYSICGFQGTYLMYVRSTKLEKTSLSFANGLSANGDGEIRTLDPLLARQVLSQLSYTPIGCGSSFLFFKKQSLYSFVWVFQLKWAYVDSNHRPHAYQACALTGWAISPVMIWHSPALPYRLQYSTIGRLGLNHRVRDGNGCVP